MSLSFTQNKHSCYVDLDLKVDSMARNWITRIVHSLLSCLQQQGTVLPLFQCVTQLQTSIHTSEVIAVKSDLESDGL